MKPSPEQPGGGGGTGVLALTMALAAVIIFAGCSGSETSATPPGQSAAAPERAEPPVSGRQTFVIVPEQSEASYIAEEEFFGLALSKYGISAGFGKAVGRTRAIEGQFELDPDDLKAAPGQNTFTIRMNTLTSDRPARDQWIREQGPRFNDYPLATFSATAIEADRPSLRGDEEIRFKLGGKLTVRNITKPVTFEVTARLTGVTLTGTAKARLLMSSFGIDPPSFANTLTAADEFGIELRFTARPRPRG